MASDKEIVEYLVRTGEKSGAARFFGVPLPRIRSLWDMYDVPTLRIQAKPAEVDPALGPILKFDMAEHSHRDMLGHALATLRVIESEAETVGDRLRAIKAFILAVPEYVQVRELEGGRSVGDTTPERNAAMLAKLGHALEEMPAPKRKEKSL